MYVGMHVCMYMCMYVSMQVCMYVYVCMYVCVYVCMYVCNVRMYAYHPVRTTHQSVCMSEGVSQNNNSVLSDKNICTTCILSGSGEVWRPHCCLSSTSVLPLSKTPHLLHNYFRDTVPTPWSPTNSPRISTSTKPFICKYQIALPASTFSVFSVGLPSLTVLYVTLMLIPRGYIRTQTIYNFSFTQ